MAQLGRARKTDLLSLIEELSLEAPETCTKPQLIEIINSSDSFDEELIKDLLIGIVAEREELEKRQFELKQLELKINLENKIDNSTHSIKNTDVLKLINKYDEREEISLYLTLFERQIKRLGVEKESWVTYLIGLLPLEMVHLISREDEELSNDYDYVKNTLLKRFKLSPEKFRQKFFAHKKDNLASWRDFSYELNNFLDEWLIGLKILTYQELKHLLIIDQIRKKLPIEMKEHFVDDLPNFTNVVDFVDKLDAYETARNSIKKNSEHRNFVLEDKRRFSQNMGNKNSYRSNNISQTTKYEKNNFNATRNNPNPFKIKCFYCNEYASHKSSQCPRRKDGIICFKCNCAGHRADQCTTKNVNTTSNNSCPSRKIIKTVEINGKNIDCIVDSGSDVTMINEKLYMTLGRPNLNKDYVKFLGISGEGVSPTGYFNTEILIDETKVNCDIYVLNNLQYGRWPS